MRQLNPTICLEFHDDTIMLDAKRLVERRLREEEEVLVHSSITHSKLMTLALRVKVSSLALLIFIAIL